MKTTYYTTGFLSDALYSQGLRLFIQQYNEKFPGLCYLHLTLEEIDPDTDVERQQLLYSADGKGLMIRLAKENGKSKTTPFELYEYLRFVFDSAVEEHLKNHPNEFFLENYC